MESAQNTWGEIGDRPEQSGSDPHIPTGEEILDRLRVFGSELDRLSTLQLTEQLETEEFICECLNTLSKSLDIQIVETWLFDQRQMELVRSAPCCPEEEAPLGLSVLDVGEFPDYVDKAKVQRTAVFEDVQNASELQDLFARHLAPRGIRSKLDVQIRSSLRAVGILCCEASTDKCWTPDEISFVSSVAGLVGLALEAVERRNYHKILQQADDWVSQQSETLKRFALMAEHATDAIIIANPKGEIEWVNKGFERLTEYTLEEVAGCKPGPILQGDKTSSEKKAEISHAIAEQKPVRLELLNYSKSGREYWLDIRMDPIFDADGKLEKFIAVEKDVTARVQERQQLAAALEDARAGYRSKSDFLATMSHEIRTPLNGVLAIGRLLQASPNCEAERDKIDLIVQSGENLLDILNNLLDLASLESGKQEIEHEDFSVHQILSQTSALLKDYAAERNLVIDAEIDETVPASVNGDSGKLSQILFNLLGNAIKFSSDGVITVRTRSDISANGRTKLTFSVTDNGIGVSEDIIPTLFEPFSQADPSITRKHGGTGLGLSICKNLCELMGGEIFVTSEQGIGSTFTFHIMVDAAEKQITANAVGPSRSDDSGSPANSVAMTAAAPCVLVAEDNAMNQQIITMIMEAMGMSPDCVANGQEAMDALELKHYDLVLMDVQMPVMDGLTATQNIRQSGKPYSNIPIIAVTANTVEMGAEGYRAAGMNGFVPKPITPSALIREIENVFSAVQAPLALAAG